MTDSITYYNQNADEFYNSTVHLDMGEFYRPFLAALPKGKCRILDAGCGSGRDARHFKSLGHEVVAFDPSEEMVKRASELIDQPVLQMRFQDMEFRVEFDGIWACASLLHVPRSEIKDVVERCRKALKPGGVLYASFKCGHGEGERGGRWFSDWDKDMLGKEIFDQASGFLSVEYWQTTDIREDRSQEKWVNCLLQRL